jgi:hypothetical protein
MLDSETPRFQRSSYFIAILLCLQNGGYDGKILKSNARRRVIMKRASTDVLGNKLEVVGFFAKVP